WPSPAAPTTKRLLNGSWRTAPTPRTPPRTASAFAPTSSSTNICMERAASSWWKKRGTKPSANPPNRDASVLGWAFTHADEYSRHEARCKPAAWRRAAPVGPLAHAQRPHPDSAHAPSLRPDSLLANLGRLVGRPASDAPGVA